MRKKTIFLIILSVVIFIHCESQKKTKYNIPAEIEGKAIEGKVKDELMVTLHNGEKLYKIHCSKCHGIFTNGLDSIPNFTKSQIDVYKAKSLVNDHKNHLVASEMLPEEFDAILSFLTYRKQK